MQIRPRLLMTLVIIGVTLDLVISVALGFIVHAQADNASTAHQIRVAAYEECLAGNTRRAADLARWDKITALLTPPTTTQAYGVFLEQLRATNRAADKPMECTAP